MNDTVMSVVAIGLAAVLMFIFPLMATADRSEDITIQVVQTATTEFVDNIRSTGKITRDKYDGFRETLAETGNSFDFEIEAQIADSNVRKKTQQTSSTKVGDMTYYSEYNSTIEDQVEAKGVYTLKEGDIITVKVKNTNRTISQVLKDFIYQVTGSNAASIVAQHSGLVNVNG